MLKKTLSCLALSMLIATPCMASSLPAGEIVQKVGIGSGPSVGVDFKLNNKTSLGFSVASPFSYGKIGDYLRYDVRALYKFFDEGKFSISGVLGVTGDPTISTINDSSLVGIEAGVALSFEFLPELTGRLNLVGSYPFMGARNAWTGYVPPAAGIELGYKFTPTIEGTIGGNGNGDYIGINLAF